MHDDDTTTTDNTGATPKTFVDPRLVLLERAIRAAGGAGHLSVLLGVSRRTIERWKNRAEYLTSDRQRALAAIAGDRPLSEAGDGPTARVLAGNLAKRDADDAAVCALGPAIDAVFRVTRNVDMVVERFPECDPAALRRYLAVRFNGAAHRGHGHNKIWSDMEMSAAIAAAADESGLVTGRMYDEYRARVQADGGDAPARVTIMLRFDGSWADAVVDAGCRPGRVRRRPYVRRWDDASLRRAVREFVVAQPAGTRDLRWSRFAEWLESDPSADRPSAATVRHRVSDWPTYVDGVAAEVDRQQAA